MIEARNISKTYENGVEALNNISFNVKEGESCSIIGPSGCGKSTLLFIFSGLLDPSGGEAKVSGRKMSSRNKDIRDIALVLQDYGLFPWKTVHQNISIGMEIRGIDKKKSHQRIGNLLSDLGLEGFENYYPKQLSGGMRQRVAFARALALDPQILLMDEPLSSLDALSRERLQNFLLDLWIKNNITMLLVTHSIEEAVFLGKKIVVLSPRPGEVVSIIDNSEAGSAEYRNKKEFFQKCREVRQSVGVI
ncbi:MAG: ABC transporter ATP-binding protein [Archaeoglobaceae archaeon]